VVKKLVLTPWHRNLIKYSSKTLIKSSDEEEQKEALKWKK